MIYPSIPLDIWINKYDLEIEKYHCPKCKRVFETIVPITTKDSAGLQSQIHDCGPEYYLVVLTPRTNEGLEFWNTIV